MRSAFGSLMVPTEVGVFHAATCVDTHVSDLISHKVFLQSQFPHECVNLFLMFVIGKDKLTDLWGG